MSNPDAKGGPGRHRADEVLLGYERDSAGRLQDPETGKYQIAELRPTHEAILNYILANPAEPLKRVAGAFGVSAGWIYTLTQTNAFRTALRERQDELFTETVASVHEKTAGVASHALDQLHERIPHESDTKTLGDLADQLLRNLGYGGARAVPGVQVNVAAPGAVSPEVLIQARGALLAVANRESNEPASRLGEEGDGRALPEPAPMDS